MSTRHFGKRRANLDAVSSDNYGKVHHRDAEDHPFEEDSYSGAQTLALKGFKYKAHPDDTEQTFTFTSNVALADVATDLEKVMFAIVDKYAYDFRIDVTYSGGTLTFAHVGQAIITKLILSDDTELSTTRKEKAIYTTTWSKQVVGAVTMANGGAAASALANSPYNHVGTPATDDATATQLQTDIGTWFSGESIEVFDVKVVNNQVDSAFDITLAIDNSADVLINDNPFVWEGDEDVNWASGTANSYLYPKI